MKPASTVAPPRGVGGPKLRIHQQRLNRIDDGFHRVCRDEKSAGARRDDVGHSSTGRDDRLAGRHRLEQRQRAALR